MFFLIGDIIFIILGIPFLLLMYKWKTNIKSIITNEIESQDELHGQLRFCNQSSLVVAVLVIYACIDLVFKVI